MARTALITGASSGIGLAIATTLASEGYDLTIAARGADRLESARAELAARDVDVHVVTTNVAREDEVIRMVAEHRERYGRLDVLVNNAGMGIPGPLDDYRTKHLDLQIDVNLRSTVIASREALPMLRAAGAEHRRAFIVNVASISGKIGGAGLSVYSATKHAVVGFTDSLNRELYPAGIRACAFCPGYVDTPLSDYVKSYISPDDMIVPEDLGESVRYLLRLSPACVVPELVHLQGDALGIQPVPRVAALGVEVNDTLPAA
jgi:NAD(P)-dependent dehydrogenase (short-subunit alcohol dehydrogenase family)